MAGAVGGFAIRGRTEAWLPEAGRVAARGVLDVHVAGELVGRAVGRVRVAGLAVDGGSGAAGVTGSGCERVDSEGGGVRGLFRKHSVVDKM